MSLEERTRALIAAQQAAAEESRILADAERQRVRDTVQEFVTFASYRARASSVWEWNSGWQLVTHGWVVVPPRYESGVVGGARKIAVIASLELELVTCDAAHGFLSLSEFKNLVNPHMPSRITQETYHYYRLNEIIQEAAIELTEGRYNDWASPKSY